MSGRQNLFAKVVALIIIFLAFGIYLYINRVSLFVPSASTTGFVSKAKPIAYDYNSQAGFYSNGQGYFYFYTKDGVSYRSSTGEVVWNDPFDMTHPEAYGAGNFIALAEIRGTAVRVYGPEGFMYSQSFDLPILNFSVNETGYCCVKLQNGSAYQTYIYNGEGKAGLIYERQDATANIFPIATALSKNGLQLAHSLLDINGVDMLTHLLLAHVQKVTSVTNADSVWGGFEKSAQVVASLKFNSNNDLLAVSDLEMTHYTISDETASEGATIVFNNEIRQLGYLGDNGIVLALGRAMPGKDAATENTIQFYNAKLSLTGEFSAPKAVTYLSSGQHGAIVGSGYTYYGLNAKGAQLWQYTATKELKELIYLGNTDTVLEAGFTEARILKREKISETTESTGTTGTTTDGTDAN